MSYGLGKGLEGFTEDVGKDAPTQSSTRPNSYMAMGWIGGAYSKHHLMLIVASN